MTDLDRQIAKLRGLQPVNTAFIEQAKDYLRGKGLPIDADALARANYFEPLAEGAFRLFEARHLDWSVNEQRMMHLVDETLAKPADGLRPWCFYVSYAEKCWRAQFFVLGLLIPKPEEKFTGAHWERLQAVGQAWCAAKEWQQAHQAALAVQVVSP